MYRPSYVKLTLMATVVLAAIITAPLSSQAQDFDPDRAIVRFLESVTAEDIDSVLENYGAIGEGTLADSATVLVRIPEGWTLELALQIFGEIPLVAYAGPNLFLNVVESSQMSQAILDGDAEPFTHGVTPDEYYTQYAISTTAMTNGQQMATGTGISVALVDNGVDFAHPLLSASLSSNGYDFVDDDADPSFVAGDFAAHGTFTAGLLLLSAPDVAIMPVRAMDGDGRGTIFDVVLGIDHAIANEADILCLGFGLSVDDPILLAAIQRAETAGIIVVAPAGNDGHDDPVQYPAGYNTVLGIGAVDAYDIRASFSNYGMAVDICAPGVDIYSALPGGDYWGRWDGTSFAAPLVAGLAAITRQLHPTVPPCGIRDIVAWGCHNIDSLNPLFAGELGEGRIDFARSSGYDTPIVSVRGYTTDSTTVAVADVNFTPYEGAEPLLSSARTANDSGFYVATVPAGTYDLVYTPSSGSNFVPTTVAGVTLSSDTTMSVVLTQSSGDPCVAPGDYNGDTFANAIDLGILVDHLFAGQSMPDAPACVTGVFGDADCDGFLTALDLAILVDYLFAGGPPPQTQC